MKLQNENFKRYIKAAQQGYAAAQYVLGVCYENGFGVKQDKQKAIEWYTKAAEQGYPAAQCNLGIIMSEQEYQAAQCNLSIIMGEQNILPGCLPGFPPEPITWVMWLTKAAEQGDTAAQCNLGYCYYRGQGVEQDYQKAIEWYTKAAEQGFESAKDMVKKLKAYLD